MLASIPASASRFRVSTCDVPGAGIDQMDASTGRAGDGLVDMLAGSRHRRSIIAKALHIEAHRRAAINERSRHTAKKNADGEILNYGCLRRRGPWLTVGFHRLVCRRDRHTLHDPRPTSRIVKLET